MDSAGALVVLTAREVAFGTLLLAGVAHVRSRSRLATQLQEQGVFAAVPRRVVAVALGPVEVVIAAFGLTATVVGGLGWLARLAGVAAAGLYMAFALFALYLWRRAPGAPCGCARDGERASGWTVGRAFVLAVLAVGGLASMPGRMVSPAALGYSAVVALALGLLIWQLPSAMGMQERVVS